MPSLASLGLSEGWLRHHLAAQPELLGQGAGYRPEQEVVQHGRLDLLLTHPSAKNLVVELQRGAADLAHLSRLVQYWRHQEQISPDSNVAILVAERYPQRLAIVFDLLTERLPFKAMLVSAERIENRVVVRLEERTKNEVASLPLEQVVSEQRFRSRGWFWAVETLFSSVADHDPELELGFRGSYVAAQRNSGRYNFFAVHDGEGWGRLELKLPDDHGVRSVLEAAGLEVAPYVEGNEARRHFPIRIRPSITPVQLAVLSPFFREAYHLWKENEHRHA